MSATCTPEQELPCRRMADYPSEETATGGGIVQHRTERQWSSVLAISFVVLLDLEPAVLEHMVHVLKHHLTNPSSK